MKKDKDSFKNSIIFKLVVAVIIIFIAMILISNYAINQRQELLMKQMERQLEISLEDSDMGNQILLVMDNAQFKSNLEFQIYTFMVVLITILSGSFIFYLVIKNVMEPLKMLTKKVSKIDMDNVQTIKDELIINEGGYEIVELSKGFDEAINKIYDGYEKQRQFSSNVAHELRTPLAILQAKIDIFKIKAQNENSEFQEFVNVMENNVQRLSNLIEGILFLSRDGDLFISDVHVKESIEEINFDLEELADKKNIKLSVIGDNPVIYTDDVLFNRAMFNLIENAIKYNVDGGIVEVSIIDSEFYVEINVKDTGIGIDNSQKKKIFDLFYRIDESRNRDTGGYGIGLALVINIINRLNGKISVEDNKPKGSIFKIVIRK